MDLMVDRNAGNWACLEVVSEFEEVILRDPRMREVETGSGPGFALANLAWNGRERLGWKSGVSLPFRIPAPARRGAARDSFAVLMWPTVRKCLPRYFLPGRKSIYLFDAWTAEHRAIHALVHSLGVHYAFVSAKQAVEELGRTPSPCAFIWIPEGVNPASYRSMPYGQKDIDVLQFGRRYDAYHERIRGPLADAGKVYLYEESKGAVVFPTRAEFVDGLARTKISVCFPSILTHPDRAGKIETMTTRYLQSMASRCLVLGHAPAELQDLFGYNPVVEADAGDPAGQIRTVLDHFTEYIPLIERNAAVLRDHHTWQHRWNAIGEILFADPTPGGSER